MAGREVIGLNQQREHVFVHKNISHQTHVKYLSIKVRMNMISQDPLSPESHYIRPPIYVSLVPNTL